VWRVFTDRATITQRAYGELGPLAARFSIYEYQQDRVDLPGLAVDALRQVTGSVLDIGWGLGTYTVRFRADRPDLHVVPLDLSPGMRPEVIADIQALPVADAQVDAALAMHMLYHVPDIPTAVRELRRVVRPGGVVLVTTNGTHDKLAFDQLVADVRYDLGLAAQTTRDGDSRFTLDDAAVLEAAFDDVAVHAFDREAVVPDPAPVVAFVNSFRGFHEPTLPDGLTWDDFMAAATRRISATVAAEGAFRFTSQVGMFVCR
jgi:SAM-dependent methyltransferase